MCVWCGRGLEKDLDCRTIPFGGSGGACGVVRPVRVLLLCAPTAIFYRTARMPRSSSRTSRRPTVGTTRTRTRLRLV